jgi:putative SOS response-associated peptidase YedK
MPVILNRDDYETWLDTENTEPEKLLPLLKPYPSEQMVLFPVSKGINSPSYDDPSFVKSIQ